MNLIFKKTILLILIIGFIFALNPIPSTSNNNELNNANLRVSTFSGKIFIDNNWTEAKAGGICTGTGTKSDPYVIKDLIMNGGGVGSCILIQNSSAFFRIENCTVYNAGVNLNDGAVKLLYVQNGLIIRNTVYNQRNGIDIEYSSDIIVTENNCYDCTGVQIFYSEDIYVYFNNFVNGEWGADFIFYAANVSWNTQKKVTYNYKGNSFTNYLGNYYSLYDKVDVDNNGISDGPVVIDQHKPTPIIVDRYPLMETIENYEITESLFISGFSLLYFSMIILFTSLGIILKLKRKKI